MFLEEVKSSRFMWYCLPFLFLSYYSPCFLCQDWFQNLILSAAWKLQASRTESFYLYINLACLSVCLSFCSYPINVKTAEPIGPKFFVGQMGTPGKVYEWSKFQIIVSIKIWSSLNFWKFWKSTKLFTINLEDVREAPYKASIDIKL